jgi:hypothetical protein
MHEIEYYLATIGQPRTVLCARELLGIAVTILAHENEDPESTLSQGPVLDIVRNVVKAMEEIDGALVLQHRGNKRRRI